MLPTGRLEITGRRSLVEAVHVAQVLKHKAAWRTADYESGGAKAECTAQIYSAFRFSTTIHTNTFNSNHFERQVEILKIEDRSHEALSNLIWHITHQIYGNSQ